MGNDSVSPIGASKTYDFNFEAIKKRLLGGKSNQLESNSFLAQYTPNSVFLEKTPDAVQGWNGANVQIIGNNITS